MNVELDDVMTWLRGVVNVEQDGVVTWLGMWSMLSRVIY